MHEEGYAAGPVTVEVIGDGYAVEGRASIVVIIERNIGRGQGDRAVDLVAMVVVEDKIAGEQEGVILIEHYIVVGTIVECAEKLEIREIIGAGSKGKRVGEVYLEVGNEGIEIGADGLGIERKRGAVVENKMIFVNSVGHETTKQFEPGEGCAAPAVIDGVVAAEIEVAIVYPTVLAIAAVYNPRK